MILDLWSAMEITNIVVAVFIRTDIQDIMI